MRINTSDQPTANLGFGNHQSNWGLHLAGLYEKEEERDEILLGFLHQGDVDGDFVLYCPCEQTADDFKLKYEVRYPETAHHTDDPERFRFLSARDLYYSSSVFSPQAMDAGLERCFAESQQRGPRNVRATAEMVWALEAISGIQHLMAYESRLNDFISGKPWISICLYNLDKFSGAMIMRVLQTHPYTISGGVITQNPYYQKPRQWLAQNASEFLSDEVVSAR